MCGTLLGMQFVPGAAIAQQRPRGQEERGSVVLGAFYTEPATRIRLDSQSGRGTELSLENDLGLQKTTTVARLGGYYWFGKRGRLDFDLFRYKRDAGRQINRTIQFGDQEYPINTVVNTSSQVTVFTAAYTFAVLQRERGFLGVTGGLYTAASRTNLNNETIGLDNNSDVDVPLPVLGVRGSYAFGRRITLRGSVEWFGITTNKASGRLTDTNIGADYSFNDRVALGIAYNKVDMNVSATSNRGLEAQLDWGYSGAMLYLKMNFGQ